MPFLAPRKRKQPNHVKHTNNTQDTQTLCFRVRNRVQLYPNIKTLITLSLFKSSSTFIYSHSDSEPPSERGTTKIDYQKYHNIREEKNRRGHFFDMHYSIYLLVQHYPTEPFYNDVIILHLSCVQYIRHQSHDTATKCDKPKSSWGLRW